MKYSECRTEQAFKMEWVKRHKKDYLEIFCIESEETVKGFPDVLIIEEYNGGSQLPQFAEFKKARNGWIEFQPTQPAFYRAHKKLLISVISLVELKGKFYVVPLPVPIVLSRLNGNRKLDLRPWCVESLEVK